MDRPSFVALTRRASLLTLSMAGLSAVARPAAVGAKGNGNAFKRCKQEASDCQTRLLAECQGDPTCPAQAACCDHLKRCKFGDFVTCLLATEASAITTPIHSRK